MVEINLIPDVKQELLKAQSARNYVISGALVVGIAAIVIVIVLALVLGAQTVTSGIIDGNITKSNKKLQNVTDLSDTLTIQNQLSKLSEMHNGKNIDSRIFPLLDAINPSAPNNVTVSNAKIDSDTKTITIEGQAPNLYEAAEAFKKTIVGTTIVYRNEDNSEQRIPLVKDTNDVTTSDISVGEDASGKKVLRFTLNFKYPDELFARSSRNAVIESPARRNVTDSYLRVPQSLFSEKATGVEGGQ
ncbi:hypothetical protein HY312_04360 [Candidatus Saccharibacteria bacterium]|nr:hypothetical protein [Candidatus Saccharibacteria bacterium]